MHVRQNLETVAFLNAAESKLKPYSRPSNLDRSLIDFFHDKVEGVVGTDIDGTISYLDALALLQQIGNETGLLLLNGDQKEQGWEELPAEEILDATYEIMSGTQDLAA